MLPWKLWKRQILPVNQNLSSVYFSPAKFQLVSCNLSPAMIWQMTYTHKLPKLCSATLKSTVIKQRSKTWPPSWQASNVKYMSLCLVFSILPHFYEIKTNFPQNYNVYVFRQSFMDVNNLVKMVTTQWKLPTDRKSVFGFVHRQCMRLSSRNHFIDPDHVCGVSFKSVWVGSYIDFLYFDHDVLPKCRQTSGHITNMLSRLCQKAGKRNEEDKC